MSSRGQRRRFGRKIILWIQYVRGELLEYYYIIIQKSIVWKGEISICPQTAKIFFKKLYVGLEWWMFGCKFDNMIEVGFYVIFLKHFLSESTYHGIILFSFILLSLFLQKNVDIFFYRSKKVVKQDKNQAMSATQK